MDFKKECYRIYCEEFGNDEFSKKLFDNCFSYCKWLEIDNKPVSVLFLLPCEIITPKRRYNAKYVFAVTTDKEYRNNGLMSELLSELNDNDVLFLKPANENLITYYEKNGFVSFDAVENRVGDKYIVLSKDFNTLATDYIKESNKKYKLMYRYKEKIDLNGLSFSYTME